MHSEEGSRMAQAQMRGNNSTGEHRQSEKYFQGRELDSPYRKHEQEAYYVRNHGNEYQNDDTYGNNARNLHVEDVKNENMPKTVDKNLMNEGLPPVGSHRPVFMRTDQSNDNQERRESNIRRLEIELEDSRRVHDEMKRRLSALEFIADDLERRLEAEAASRIEIEGLLDKERQITKEQNEMIRRSAEEQAMKLKERDRQEEKLSERLRRLERELYRVHKKRHEMISESRRQDPQKRIDEDNIQTGRMQPTASHSVTILSGAEKDHNGQHELRSETSILTSTAQTNQRIRKDSLSMSLFPHPSQALAEEQNRSRMIQSLSDFFGCPDVQK